MNKKYIYVILIFSMIFAISCTQSDSTQSEITNDRERMEMEKEMMEMQRGRQMMEREMEKEMMEMQRGREMMERERMEVERCDLVAGANEDNMNYGIENGANREKCTVFRYGNLLCK